MTWHIAGGPGHYLSEGVDRISLSEIQGIGLLQGVVFGVVS